jgi:hypothetical protein
LRNEKSAVMSVMITTSDLGWAPNHFPFLTCLDQRWLSLEKYAPYMP